MLPKCVVSGVCEDSFEVQDSVTRSRRKSKRPFLADFMIMPKCYILHAATLLCYPSELSPALEHSFNRSFLR